MEVQIKKFNVSNVEDLIKALSTIISELDSTDKCEKVEKKVHRETKEGDVLKEAMNSLQTKLSCNSPLELEAILNKISSFNKGAALSLVLREIAIVLDKQYKDNIRNAEELYGISFVTGKIVRINKASVRGYQGFAAFRTMEDAKTACRILKQVLRDMFNE